MSTKTQSIPQAFIWRRVHSLMGFALVVYLTEHFVTNSQAALWVGQDGAQFIKMVNFIHSLPYLKVLEILLIAIPIFFHGLWGVKYALTAKSNAKKTDGTKPSLKEHGKNRAYSFQRLSSWVLLIGIILHVVQMRFIDYPVSVSEATHHFYLTKISMDEGLYTLTPRLGVTLYNREEIKQMSSSFDNTIAPKINFLESNKPIAFDKNTAEQIEKKVTSYQSGKMAKALLSFSLTKDDVVAVSPDPGTAFLLNVRNTFKSFWMIGFYTLFVLAAGFHAFNGLWTFLISWGIILSYRSQKKMANVCMGLTILMILLGLSAVWGTYWINLRY